MNELVIGIEVQSARDCPYAVLDASIRVVESGWLPTADIASSVRRLAVAHKGAVFAIDAPRMGLSVPRLWHWNIRRWRERTHRDVGHGRHCEVVIKAHGLANPQWTPFDESAPLWMQHGFAIFLALDGLAQ